MDNEKLFDLEDVSTCPACTSSRYTELYSSAEDHFFGVKGKWHYVKCEDCGSLFLKPRPTEGTIHRAYEDYYTHNASDSETPDHSRGTLMQRAMLACLKQLYYSESNDSSRIAWLPFIIPGKVRQIRRLVRLGRPPVQRQRLLDVGCGNGDYVSLATQLGWDARGVEPDNRAVEFAQKAGLSVTAGSITSVDMNHPYDAITLSHVIEHVHNPYQFLMECRQRLNRGGQLWLETPNAESPGHARFGAFWRGLEPPRHLCIFTIQGLFTLLKRAGFDQIQHSVCGPQRSYIFQHSKAALARNKHRGPGIFERLTWRSVELIQAGYPKQREFITVKAHRTN